MFTRKIYYLRKSLERQWTNPQKIREFQFKKLKAIIVHSYKHTRFYRKLWDSAGVKPGDIRAVGDIKKLPIITREQIMDNYSELIAQCPTKNIFDEKLSHSSLTSGSSGGHSFRIIHNESAWDYYEAVYLRALLNVGYRPWHKMAYYWYEPFTHKFYNSIGLMKKDYIAHNLTFSEQIEVLEKLNPDVIYYFPSILYTMANLIGGGSKIQPKVIITHAELLSNKMRKKIEDTFNVPVYDQYGTAEFNRMAWECKVKKGYHIDEDSILLETVKGNEDVANGELGDIVVTGLWNYTLPLIRYKIGDIGVPMDADCSCGRGFSMLKEIVCRESDIINIQGRKFLPKDIIDAIYSPELVRFSFGQKSNDSFELNMEVKNGHKFSDVEKTVERSLGAFFKDVGANIKIDIAEGCKPVLPRGKFKIVNGLDKRTDLINLDPFSRIR